MRKVEGSIVHQMFRAARIFRIVAGSAGLGGGVTRVLRVGVEESVGVQLVQFA